MQRSGLVLLLAGCALAWAGCASPGAPLPPSLDLPRPVEDLAYARQGQRVILTWTPPQQTTDKQNVRRLGATFICRTIEQYPIRDCQPVKRLEPEELSTLVGDRQQKVVFEDPLPDAAIAPGAFATYAIEVFNPRGRTAGLSNQVRVPLAPTIAPPADLRAEVRPSGVQLLWTGVSPNDLPPAARQLTFYYRVYRRQAGSADFRLVQEVPVEAEKISVYDPGFEWESNYEYKVVPVTEVPVPNAPRAEIEGTDSPVITVNAHDAFPPAQPTGVQAVFSSVGQNPFIDLTWGPNAEPDLAGYNVFRHEQGGGASKINNEPVKAPSFRDTNVRAGATYFYSVSAFDLRGNESARSIETSETVPQ